jgi:hypothetical protein
MTTVGAENNAPIPAGFFRQIQPDGLFSPLHMKSMSAHIQLRFAGFFLLALILALPAVAQTNYYATNGPESAIVGSLAGDQVLPDVAISPAGGFVVWQDNATDDGSWGISATELGSPTWQNERVSIQGVGSQENPRVALLKGGGAVFVWQGGTTGFQHIYARFVTPAGTFLPLSSSILVNTSTNCFQMNPAVAVLNNSNVVVVWSSFNQAEANSLQDVYAAILSPTGATVQPEFLVNQFTAYNQRTPSVAALNNGGFVVTWVSEQQQQVSLVSGSTNSAAALLSMLPSVDIYAQLYQSNGAAVGSEFPVDVGSNPCANPRVAAASDGSFMVAWSGRDMATITNGWDVYARSFDRLGTGGTVVRLNTYLYGNQYAPRLSAIGVNYLAVWTSLGQDGSREGVYGQFINSDGSLVGGEFRVNTTTISQQMQPVVASDGVSQFIAVWTSYTGNPYSFDLFAQSYKNVSTPLEPVTAYVWVPFVLSSNTPPKYQPQLVVTWTLPAQGVSVSNYEIFVDGAATNIAAVASNQWTMTAVNGLTTNSTHYFQVDYVTTDGRRPLSLSPSASGTTYSGSSWGGIPYEWMTTNYGSQVITFNNNGVPTFNWPSANTSLVAGGPTLYQIFLSGADPFDSTTWLQTALVHTPTGLSLSWWKTQPGATYQVQVTTNFSSWSNFGTPVFAPGYTNYLPVGNSPAGYYRVMLLR